jgi:hypothetical protein
MLSSISVLVDVDAVLSESTLANNAYLVDNTRFLASGEPTPDTTYIYGALHADGSQASQEIMNWFGFGIAAPPPNLSKALYTFAPPSSFAKPANISRATQPLRRMAFEVAGRLQYVPMAIPSLGEGRDSGHEIEAADLSPRIVKISGPAVDEGVIYPAEYGGPDYNAQYAYWAATVDVNKTGTHDYFIHLLVYRPKQTGGEKVFAGEQYIYKAQVCVQSGVLVNGFTYGTPGVLPLVPAPLSRETELATSQSGGEAA